MSNEKKGKQESKASEATKKIPSAEKVSSQRSEKKRRQSHDATQRVSQYNMAVGLADWLKSVGVEANSAKVYEKVLNDRQYKTMFDLVEAQPSREDLLRYGLEDDRNMLVFLKGLRDASAEFDRKKSSKGSKTKSGDIIALNVGGAHYQTRRDTLLSLPNTYFTKLLAGKEAEATSEFFIDRDGAKFEPILNYLRDVKDHYLLNKIDPVEAVFYSLPLPPLVLVMHNTRQEMRAIVNRVHDELAGDLQALLESRPINQDFVLLPIISQVEWLNLIHHHTPLESACKQVMFEHLHPKINSLFWSEFREAFKELRLSFEILHERVDTLSAYTMKVHYIGVSRSDVPFTFDKTGTGALLVCDVRDSAVLQGTLQSPRNTGLQSKASMLNLSGHK